MQDGRDFEHGYFDGYDRKPPASDAPEYMHGYSIGVEIEQPSTFYHRTDSAAAILANGFRDAEGSYGIAGVEVHGVFISDVPLDMNEGASGDELFEIKVPADVDLREYELIQPRSAYREWCVPAGLLNELCALRLLETDPGDESDDPAR